MRIGVCTEGIVRWSAEGDGVLLDLPHRTLAALLRAEPDSWRDSVEDAPALRPVGTDDVTPATPIDEASSVWGIGLNYASKVQMTGRTPPEEPTLFLRSSATGAGPGGRVVLPEMSDAVDFEGELAVVIGTPARDVGPAQAWGHVAALTAANDITARDVMRRNGNPTLAKSFPGFGPIGWALATPDEFADPDDLLLVTTVNGTERQRDRTSGMLLSVPELLALVSRYVELHPGDVLLTGSPSGAGDEDGCYLRGGDVVEVRIADLAPLRTVIVAAEQAVGV